jgi:hypothetical protein
MTDQHDPVWKGPGVAGRQRAFGKGRVVVGEQIRDGLLYPRRTQPARSARQEVRRDRGSDHDAVGLLRESRRGVAVPRAACQEAVLKIDQPRRWLGTVGDVPIRGHLVAVGAVQPQRRTVHGDRAVRGQDRRPAEQSGREAVQVEDDCPDRAEQAGQRRRRRRRRDRRRRRRRERHCSRLRHRRGRDGGRGLVVSGHRHDVSDVFDGRFRGFGGCLGLGFRRLLFRGLCFGRRLRRRPVFDGGRLRDRLGGV